MFHFSGSAFVPHLGFTVVLVDDIGRFWTYFYPLRKNAPMSVFYLPDYLAYSANNVACWDIKKKKKVRVKANPLRSLLLSDRLFVPQWNKRP